MLGSVAHTMRHIIELDYLCAEGEIIYEPHRTSINRLDQTHFLLSHKPLFAGSHVLELGCGDSYIRELKSQLGYAAYIGVDSRPDSRADEIVDFNSLEFEAFLNTISPYDCVISFQQMPVDLGPLHSYMSSDGYLIHQSTPRWYNKNHIHARIANHFHLIEKINYRINITGGTLEHTITNLFVVGKSRTSDTAAPSQKR